MPACRLRSALAVLLTVLIVDLAAAAPPAANRAEYATQLWEAGQAAMRVGRLDKAVAFFQQSLAADPKLVRNHLSLSAVSLEMGEPDRACGHLTTYLHFCPDQTVVRAHLAELLIQLGRPAEARGEFERFAADCPAHDADDLKRLIHCHSRLMEIAESLEDEYGEHLHRGIGLFLLAKHRGDGESSVEQSPPEALLCKAAAELTQARLERPDQARPSWYLFQVWAKLGRRQPALRCLADADEAAPFSELTPAEQRGLTLACRDRSMPR